jgi:hypothetical protein
MTKMGPPRRTALVLGWAWIGFWIIVGVPSAVTALSAERPSGRPGFALFAAAVIGLFVAIGLIVTRWSRGSEK